MMVAFSYSVAEYAVKCARDGNFEELIKYLNHPDAPIEGEMRQLLVEIVKRSKRLVANRPSATAETMEGWEKAADQVSMLMARGLGKTDAVQEVARERKRSTSYVWSALRAFPDEDYSDESAT